MAGNSLGKMFKVTTFGESHGPAIGVIIDGCPADIGLTENDIQKELDKRKPGKSRTSTTRKELDKAQVLSGVFNNRTTGTPISVIVYNADADSTKYEPLKNIFRPGHADFTYLNKYGVRDHRGGGRSSARETVGRVAAGAIAKKILAKEKTKIIAYTKALGNITIKKVVYSEIKRNELCCPDKSAVKKMIAKVEAVKKLGNSLGGIVEIVVKSPTEVDDLIFSDSASNDFFLTKSRV